LIFRHELAPTQSGKKRPLPNGALPSLIALSIGLAIAIAFDFLLRTVRARIIDVTGKKLDVILASDIFEHVLAIKMAQRPGSVGILANQMRDFEAVREFFTSGTVVAATDLLFALLFIAVLFVIAGPLAWIPVVVLPVMIVVGLILQRPLNRAVKRLEAESSARHGVLVESLSAIETVRVAGAEARMQRLWEKSVVAATRTGEDVQFWSTMSLTLAGTAQQLTSLLMIAAGVFLILDGRLSMGALIAANMLAGRVLAPISGIASVITRATQTVTSLRSINKLMSLERERPPGRAYLARQVKHGSIVFDNVKFKYPNAAMNALDGVSFSIAPGERVGIIGQIGSGKTTVGRLLTGLYDPDEGCILIDGVDLRQYDPADLRHGIGFVLQDIDLLFGRLRDNIALGLPSATEKQLLEAARLAGVEQFAAAHPLGYDLPVQEGGRSLSGGQKQAIGLARAIIRKPRILFLDEPTAHFDLRSEAEFIERLKRLAEGDMTILVSTHRMSMLAIVDRLLVFERGHVIADGPRDQIIARLQAVERSPAFQPPASVKVNAAV
jgi:ATP-binding cassette, subfamily C, bacterial LapB